MKDFFQLIGYLKGYQRYVYLSIFCNVMMAVFMIVSIPAIIPFFKILFESGNEVAAPASFSFSNFEDFINYQFYIYLESHTKEQALAWICFFFVMLFFFKNLFRYLAMFFMANVRNGVVSDIRHKLFQKFLFLPFAFFSRERKGDLISRITTDVQEVENSILNVLETTFKEPIVILGSIIFMVAVSPSLTIFVFILILFTTFVIGGISRTLKKKSHVVQGKLGNLISLIEESLSGMRIIKGFNAEELQADKFDKENQSYRHLLTRIMWRRDLSSPLSEFLGITIVSVLLWYGSRQVFSGQIQPELFFTFLFAFYNVIAPAKSFSSAYYHIQKGLAAMERVNHILDLPDKIHEDPNPAPLENFEHSVSFEGVSFSYPKTQQLVLRDINFTVKKGQIMALVGSSGSGKSTLVDLIPRFHDPVEGRILLDGKDIKRYRIKDLRDIIGIVSQEAILFNDTILNNITFSTKGSTLEDVIQAAKYANAHDFIMETPNGYDTVIGDRGSLLSGGQRQRLTIARALLKNPPLLILDEATASLDSESERLVQQALEHVMRGRTSIVIAHRLSTIQHADMILVMKDGKIVETGSHEDLLTAKGEYNKFVALQAFS